jgi:hypothetical protein
MFSFCGGRIVPTAIWLFLSVLMLGTGMAADHPDLNGTWLLDQSQSVTKDNQPDTLSITQKPDAIRISLVSEDKDRTLEMDCSTLGQECKVTEGGKPAQLSVYYNGPRLVLLEFGGRHQENGIKRRIGVSDDGNSLQMEIIHILASGEKTENFTFVKQQKTATAKPGI